MNPKLEETITIDFITSSATGAAADADSTPTCEVFEDTTDVAILTPTVVKRTSKTGNYRIPIACTALNGFEAGKSYNVIVSATIGTVAAKAKVASFQLRAKSVDGVGFDMTQAVPTTNTAQTVGDALNAARAQGFGKWVKVGTSLVLYAPDGTTIVRTFTLDSNNNPTART
jgi:hypothetical protein